MGRASWQVDGLAVASRWVDVREPVSGKLLFRFDPIRGMIEVQRRGVKTLIDLTQYQEESADERREDIA